MPSEILFGILFLIIGLFVLAFGDRRLQSKEGFVSELFSHKKRNIKVIKWTLGIIFILFGFAFLFDEHLSSPIFQIHTALYWTGLVAWITCSLCLAIIGLRNSVWISTGRTAFSELSKIDIKFAKLAGIFFGIGSVLFIIGAVI